MQRKKLKWQNNEKWKRLLYSCNGDADGLGEFELFYGAIYTAPLLAKEMINTRERELC